MKKIFVFLFVAPLLIVSFAYAHEGASGVVKQRMDMMEDVAKSMKVIGDMVQEKTTFDGEGAKSAALTIRKHGTHFPKLFEEKTLEKPSEALPAIWDDWAEFTEIFDDMNVHSEKIAELAPIAENAEELEAEFRLLGKACAACHTKFRVKQ